MRKILSSKWLGLVCVTAAATACGGATGFDTSQMLKLEIQGVHRAPSGAAGNGTPRRIDMTFANLILTKNDGVEVDLSPTEAEKITVINRPQIFFEVDLKDYDKVIFSAIKLVFSQEVEIQGRYKKLPLTLASGEFINTTGLTVTSAVSQSLTVEIEWANTAYVDEALSDEVFTEPAFTTTLGKD